MNNNDKQYVYFMRFADKNGVNKLDKIGIGTDIKERKSTNLRLARSFNKEVSDIKHMASVHLSSLGDAVEAEVQLKKLIEPATIKDKNEWFKPNEDTTQSINSFLLHLSENKEVLDDPKRREVFSFLNGKNTVLNKINEKYNKKLDKNNLSLVECIYKVMKNNPTKNGWKTHEIWGAIESKKLFISTSKEPNDIVRWTIMRSNKGKELFKKKNGMYYLK